MRVWALRVAGLAVVVGVWLYATGPGGVSPLILPKLTDVASACWELVSGSSIWPHVAITLLEIAIALAIALPLGFAAGFLGSRTALRARVYEPLLAWGYMVPHVMFFPLFLLWVGVGIWSKVLFAAVAGFFPIAMNTLRGFDSVDPGHLRVGRAFGASKLQLDWLVKLGAAAPMVLAGVRIGVALSVINVILGEMLASQRGLGHELARTSQTLVIPEAFAVIMVLLVVVGVFHYGAQRIELRHHRG
jgi:NitT/TauT family transport system permease protein